VRQRWRRKDAGGEGRQAPVEVARALVRDGRYAEASTRLTAPGVDHDAASLELLARLWLQAGEPAAARSSAQDALARDPGHAPAQYVLGLACRAAGELAAAIGHYQDALAHDPGLVDAEIALGVALRASGRPEEARACYLRALALAPGHRVAQWNLAALPGAAAAPAAAPGGARRRLARDP
jgi:tetratricopeptide (TPR) repeat protein